MMIFLRYLPLNNEIFNIWKSVAGKRSMLDQNDLHGTLLFQHVQIVLTSLLNFGNI